MGIDKIHKEDYPMITESAFLQRLLHLIDDCPEAVVGSITDLAYSLGREPRPSSENPPDIRGESGEPPERTS